MTNRVRGIRQTLPPGTVLARVGNTAGPAVPVKITSLVQGSSKTASGGGGGGASLPPLTNGDIWVGDASDVATAVIPSGDVTMTNAGVFTIKTNVALAGSPTTTTQATSDNSTKIATTAFVQAIVAGLNPAESVNAATIAAGDTSSYVYNNGASGIGATLTGTVNTAVTIDGFTFTAVNQRLLVKNDTQSPSGAFNGVYFLSQLQTALLAPVFTRSVNYDQPSDINNTGPIPVFSGTANASTMWVLTSTVTTVGTDPLTYAQFATGATGANPTATAKDTAVNGSAGTFMRSDGAPAVQKASSSQFGLVEVDGTTITAVGGVISATGGAVGSGSWFSPTMKRPSTILTLPGTTLATLGDTFNSVGTAGGSGGGIGYGVTLATSSSGGCNGNSIYLTSKHVDAAFTFAQTQITNCRLWVGLASINTAMTDSDTPGGSFLGFRFSTSVPDTHWICMTSDGTHINTADSGVAPIAGGGVFVFQELAIRTYDGTTIDFYINGTLVQTMATQLPLTTTGLRYAAFGRAITSTGCQISFGGAQIFMDWYP